MMVQNTYKIEVRSEGGVSEYMHELAFAEMIAAVRVLYITGMDFRVEHTVTVIGGSHDAQHVTQSALMVGDWIPF